ncbi:DDE-type integrase/transposase/recombinase, partial [Petrotoga sp. 9PWA.NaAc.5.4]|uniref:DDE-type integrase/transposase/recombinase n=1 Tax=Petrotoga sp. 9PWA.NaAc.5.4 TaxID=1434328 RepID=UPI000CB064B0
MSSSSFYFKTRLFFVVETIKAKPKQKRFVGFSYTINGQIIEDEHIKEIIISIYENNNPNDPTFYFKSLGDKKLSVVFKNQLGIIVNHKKIYRIRKELGVVRAYRNHFKHPKRRPHNHEIDAPNRFWEGDIKFIPTKYDGFVHILDIIDAFDKTIVSSKIGHSSKSKDFIKAVYNGISYRKADPKKLIIRTDNGPQFKSKATKSFMDEMEITHEFGYKNNPNSQAFIESHHSSLEREFVQLNSFENIEDVFQAYK